MGDETGLLHVGAGLEEKVVCYLNILNNSIVSDFVLEYKNHKKGCRIKQRYPFLNLHIYLNLLLNI